MKRPIHNYGDPVLREEAQPITDVDATIRTLAADMIETMHAQSGIGLAAQQVGETHAICVIDLPRELDTDEQEQPANEPVDMPMVLLNPTIVADGEETWSREEGCLSFPEILGRIERPWTIRLRYMDLEGETQEKEFHGMLARVMQHEIDHLNGVLFIDRMSHVKRLALKGRLRRLKQDTEEQLSN